MEQTILTISIIFALPFILTLWLYGWTLFKKLFNEGEWTQKKGIEKAVAKWSQMSSEERMDAIRQSETEAKTEWIKSPTPKDEEKLMNERVFREGFIHELPKTELEDKDI